MPIWNPSLSRYPHYIQRISLHKYLSRCLSTVYALSSGQGKCGVAVVRVTGDKASEALTSMTDPPVLPRARIVSLRRIIHPVTGERLDHGLVLWFPGPRSFTGEDSCELQIHGGPAVITAVLDGLSCLPGFQPAQPGDFTKRAFYNGKLDLTSVEGLGDLIHAETEAQRKQALQQMEGALGQLYSGWRETLLHCRANIEAFIDFSEDENIEEGVIAEVETKIRGIMKEMKSHLSDDRRGERLRSGLKLAILGRPNVGKSSFLNILVQRPAAIVSPTPGTTRDIVETTIDFGGYPVVLSDTAGLRNTEDVIEMEGIKRALARSKEADIAVIILDAKEVLSLIKEKHFDWENYLISFFCDIGVYNEQTTDLDYDSSDCWIKSRNYIILINKVDLIHCEKDRTILRNACKNSCLISIKTRDGFDEALLKLKKNCSTLCQIGTSENPTLTAARHRIHISSCLESLKSIIANDFEARDNLGMVAHPVTNNLQNGNNLILSSTDSSNIYYENTKSSRLSDTTDLNFLELDQNLLHSEETLLLAAHHLQKATNHLGYVTGHVTTEDVLNHIFSAFCIGK